MCETEKYLAHYGVPGMRWGHRKARPLSAERSRYLNAKSQYKADNKAYSKSFNKAYSYSSRHPISQYVGKKQKAESNRRWEDAYDKVTQANKSRSAMKQAKKEYHQTNEYKAKRAKALKTGAAVAGTALAAYGAHKVSKYVKDTNASIAGKKAYEQAEKRFQNETVSGLYERAKSMQNNGSVKGMVQDVALSGNKARDAYADTRNRTSTAQAAKNVINYRRKNGRNSLKNARNTYNAVKNKQGSSFRMEW